jgi:hypothetical protein
LALDCFEMASVFGYDVDLTGEDHEAVIAYLDHLAGEFEFPLPSLVPIGPFTPPLVALAFVATGAMLARRKPGSPRRKGDV